jgi:hypothetical protein
MKPAVILISALFGLLHLWALFEGVSNLIYAPAAFTAQNLGAYIPWWLLILGVALPVITFTAATLIGRRRVISHRVALLVVSLAVSNAFVLSASELALILVAWQAG